MKQKPLKILKNNHLNLQKFEKLGTYQVWVNQTVDFSALLSLKH
jgi:hypothetical protein